MIISHNAFVPQIIGPGLFITVQAGTIFLAGSGSNLSVPRTVVSLSAGVTNFVFFDFVALIVNSNTTGFPNQCFPIATVTTSNSGVLSLVDNRPDVFV